MRVDGDIDDISKAIDIVGSFDNIRNMYGPNLYVKDKDKYVTEAKKLAIQMAREEAEQVAAELGKRVKGVYSYYEEMPDGYYPVPAYEGTRSFSMTADSESVDTEISPGEQKITAKVTVTFYMK